MTFMASLLYDTFTDLVGGGMLTTVASFVSTIIAALNIFFSDENVNFVLGIFSGIASSLLIIFFLMDLMSRVSMDMLTIEKLMLAIIKLFIGMTILIMLPQILKGLFNLCEGIYEYLADTVTYGDKGTASALNGVEFFGKEITNGCLPDYSDVQTKMEDVFGSGALSYLTHNKHNNFGLLLVCMIMKLGTFIAKAAAYFVVVSNAITLLAHTLFTPVAVVQCFEDGTRSSGIRYLKKFVATALSFAVILGVLWASSQLNSSVLGSLATSGTINDTATVDSFLFSKGLMLIVIKLAVIGALMKSQSLANDVVGV